MEEQVHTYKHVCHRIPSNPSPYLLTDSMADREIQVENDRQRVEI